MKKKRQEKKSEGMKWASVAVSTYMTQSVCKPRGQKPFFARGTGGGTFAPGRNSQGTCPRHHGHLVARHGSVSRPWLPRNTQGPREASRHRAGSQRPSRTTQRRFACSRPGRQQHHHMATCDRDLLGNVPRLPSLPDGQRTPSMLRHLGAKQGASRVQLSF